MNQTQTFEEILQSFDTRILDPRLIELLRTLEKKGMITLEDVERILNV